MLVHVWSLCVYLQKLNLFHTKKVDFLYQYAENACVSCVDVV